MSSATPHKLSPEEIRKYRDNVETLIAACLALIRRYPIERDADPAEERQRS